MKSTLCAMLLLVGAAVAHGEPAPFAVLAEPGMVFEYAAKVVSEEPRLNGRGERVEDADGNPAVIRKVARPTIRIVVQAVEKLAGAQLAELRTQVEGKAPDKLFAARWIAITPRGVHDLAGRKPAPALLTKLLKRKPKWPLDAPAKTCEPDREEIDTGSSNGKTTFTEGNAGTEQIKGRRAICRCHELQGGSQSEELTECLDPRLGFVKLSYLEKDTIEGSSREWEATLVRSKRGNPPASSEDKKPGQTTPWPPLDLAAVLPAEAKRSRELYGKAKVCEQRNDTRCAVERYTESLRADPGNLVARFYLAVSYEQSGRRDHAITLLAELAFKKGCRGCAVVFGRVWLENLTKLTSSPEFKKAFGKTSGGGQPAAKPAAKPIWPALDLRAVASAKVQEARLENALGLKRHHAGDYRAAIGHFAAALKANPGHLLARYNLACATLRLGDKDGALSILRMFAAAAGCPECKRILSHARSDRDMADLRDSAEFKKLTAR